MHAVSVVYSAIPELIMGLLRRGHAEHPWQQRVLFEGVAAASECLDVSRYLRLQNNGPFFNRKSSFSGAIIHDLCI